MNNPSQEGSNFARNSNPVDSVANENQNEPDNGQTNLSNLEPAGLPGFLDSGSLPGTLLSAGGFASLIQMGNPVGAPGISQTAGLTAEVVAGLATDLAAGYSQNNGVQTLLLNLEPEHLGRVEVRLQAKGDHLVVRMVTANPEAESALRENLKELAEAIQVRTGRFQQVEVRVELKNAYDKDHDPKDPDHQDSHGQDASQDNHAQAEGHEEMPTDTEPDGRAQEG